MTLDKFDELFASFARPWQIYACSSCASLGLILCVYLKAGDVAITAGFATVGGLGGYTGYLRTAEKKIAASATQTTTDTTTTKSAASPLSVETQQTVQKTSTPAVTP